MVMVCQSPGAFLPHGSVSEGCAPGLGSHRARVALWHSVETCSSNCSFFSWIRQAVWLRKEVVFIFLSDSASALVTASRSNLLRFLVLPLGTNFHLKIMNPLQVQRDQKADSDLLWAPWVTRAVTGLERAYFVGSFFFSFLKFIYYFLKTKEQNRKQNQKHN